MLLHHKSRYIIYLLLFILTIIRKKHFTQLLGSRALEHSFALQFLGEKCSSCFHNRTPVNRLFLHSPFFKNIITYGGSFRSGAVEALLFGIHVLDLVDSRRGQENDVREQLAGVVQEFQTLENESLVSLLSILGSFRQKVLYILGVLKGFKKI